MQITMFIEGGPFFPSDLCLAFFFIAVFLKHVIKVINEKVIFSVTLSYWFLLLIKGSEFSAGTFVFPVVPGAGPTAGAVTLIYCPGTIREKNKMEVVHLLFNGGILYYAFIFSLMYRDIRGELHSYTG